jgi:hypothetical protein
MEARSKETFGLFERKKEKPTTMTIHVTSLFRVRLPNPEHIFDDNAPAQTERVTKLSNDTSLPDLIQWADQNVQLLHAIRNKDIDFKKSRPALAEIPYIHSRGQFSDVNYTTDCMYAEDFLYILQAVQTLEFNGYKYPATSSC